MGKISLENIVQAVNDLPSLPQVVLRVMELTEDPDSTAQDINEVLTQDQGMTARVLKLANSAFYGFPRRIATVTEATVLLGFKTIRSLVMAASVSDMLSQKIEGYALEYGELWKHSQCCAMTARHIARKIKFGGLEVAYTAGLLHDIGKVVLNTYMKETYREVLDKVQSESIPFLQSEQSILGFDHAQVGAQVAEKWNLPPELVETIACHHEPEQAKVNPKLTAIIHLANVVCSTMGIGLGIDSLLYPVSSQALEILGLQPADVDVIISEMADICSDQQSFDLK
ncbi:MAG TPA: HDOD domain-containing protein [Syntrophomonadaceae bacterium]|nr:HDOD domain-containing protein [Syntrophomonadaceae bacterium]HOQ09616.1 HDOD domain-containing protein [Syntrophomonadaceae bacterium]HPU48116.1 HDOD domain-containing protein [Syntrophomonadaceae bacterium]